MSGNLSQNDWLTISAYLDGRLADTEKAVVESRLATDANFKTALLEIRYTRSMIRSLPQKRAPRNFTLSTEFAKKRSLKWGLNRYFGLASATSGIIMAVIFAWSNLFTFSAKMAAPAPMAAAPMAESALDSSATANESNSGAPMIIYWGPPQQAYGMGGSGGGGDTFASTVKIPAGVGGGEAPELPPVAVTESPMAASQLATSADPSTLILGLPEPGTEGEILQRSIPQAQPSALQLPASTIWMIGLGAGSLIFAVLAIFLRRR